ncbi:MAG: hypothetical protein ACRDT8_18100, partial [Micromonosporaceae bacterium]
TERTLIDSYRQVADGHSAEADVTHTCGLFIQQCEAHLAALQPTVDRYGEQPQTEPERLRAEGLPEARTGPVGLLRDLQDLFLLAAFLDITWTVVGQAAQGVPDRDLLRVVQDCQAETSTQLAWLRTRLKQAAPQALLVAT